MRKFTFLILAVFFIIVLVCFFLDRNKISKFRPKESIIAYTIAKIGKPSEVKKERPPERIGERIVYFIRFGNITLGRAIFSRLPGVELDGRIVSLMTFETKLARFKDLEKIYSDRESFLPLKVERDIAVWPVPEKISEDYDQENFVLTIIKSKGRKKEQMVIKKDGPIHNAIILPFYIRNAVKLDIGWSMRANLPNQRFEIRLVSIEDINVPAGNFKAYRFESTPKRFEIWISADERRIPIKINGAGPLGYTFILKEYIL